MAKKQHLPVYRIELKHLHSRLSLHILDPTQLTPLWIFPPVVRVCLLGMPSALLLWGLCSHYTCCQGILLRSFNFVEPMLSAALSPVPSSCGRPFSTLQPFCSRFPSWVPIAAIVSITYLAVSMFPSIGICNYILPLEIDHNLLQFRDSIVYILCFFNPVDPHTVSCTWQVLAKFWMVSFHINMFN